MNLIQSYYGFIFRSPDARSGSARDSFQNRVSGETEARFFYTHRPLPPKFKLLIPEPQPLNKL